MEENKIIYPVLRNLKNNIPYKFLGGNRYRNIITNAEGEVPEDIAAKEFKINLEATELVNKYPILETAISVLKLRIEKSEK